MGNRPQAVCGIDRPLQVLYPTLLQGITCSFTPPRIESLTYVSQSTREGIRNAV